MVVTVYISRPTQLYTYSICYAPTLLKYRYYCTLYSWAHSQHSAMEGLLRGLGGELPALEEFASFWQK